MSNQAYPWPFVDYLIQYFGLNECEAADLSDQAQQLLDSGMAGTGLTDKLWIRVDILVSHGSPMQATWDMVKRAGAAKGP